MSWLLAKVLAPIIVLGILVLVHEFGHFIVAKWCGVGVLKFAVGFGPALFRFRKGETVYQIGLIPLGGFVRMVGDMPDGLTGPQQTDEAVRAEDEEKPPIIPFAEDLSPEARAMLGDRSRWFIEKGYWAKSAIVFAGPFFNLLLALGFTFFCLAYYGQRTADNTPTLGTVMLGSPAELAGLQAGDSVKRIGETEISSWKMLAETIREGTGEPVKLLVDRSGQQMEFTATPQAKTINGDRKLYFLGITPLDKFEHEPMSITDAASLSFLVTVDRTLDIYAGMWSMIRGRVSTDELAGPVYIVKTAGHYAERGLEDLMYLTSVLSVSLAVLNLLPIPILDGGHLLFFLIEALMGPISIRKKEIAQQIGLVLLLSLMVFAIRNDFVRKTPESTKGPEKWESFADPANPVTQPTK